LSLDISVPTEKASYLIQWSNKLDIGNCDMHMMDEKVVKDGVTTIEKQVVVSYKSIGINTFNVFVIDL